LQCACLASQPCLERGAAEKKRADDTESHIASDHRRSAEMRQCVLLLDDGNDARLRAVDDVEPVLPQVKRQADSGIDTKIHSRRGVVGAFREEAPQAVVQLLNAGLISALATHFGWPRA